MVDPHFHLTEANLLPDMRGHQGSPDGSDVLAGVMPEGMTTDGTRVGDPLTWAQEGDEVAGDGDTPGDLVYENTSGIDFEALAERLTNSPPVVGTDGSKVSGLGSAHPGLSSYQTQAHRMGILGPRFQLYSEAFGSLSANRLEGFDFSGLELEQPLVETLQRTPFWLDVTDPTRHELLTLRKIFGIHPLTSEDLETEETREKSELFFVNYFFVCFRSFDHDRLSLSFMQPVNFYLVVFRECILTFHAKPLPHPSNVLRRIQQLKSATFNPYISPDWINYALIDDITDSFGPVLRSIEGEVEAIDDLVLILKESEQSDMLRRIGQSRKRVMQMMRLLGTKGDVVKSIIHRVSDRVSPGSDTKLYLADIQGGCLLVLSFCGIAHVNG
jgi:magnesium transporter